MTDKEKFLAWLAQCPVTVKKFDDNFVEGWIELVLQCEDEKDTSNDDT